MKLRNMILGLVFFNFTGAVFAQPPATMPDWFRNDLARSAGWLPPAIRSLGFEKALQQRWVQLPLDIQQILQQAQIPSWMIALIPTEPSRQNEINKQLRGMLDLAGTPNPNPIAARAEQLLILGGSAQLPTPGDERTGQSLGHEGCTSAMSHYIIAQLKLEFPKQLAAMPDRMTHLQSSVELKSIVLKSFQAKENWLQVKDLSFGHLQNQDIEPGDLLIAQKPGGTHVFGWTRVPRFWNWDSTDKMSIGNTGLPQYGDRLILAQEFLTDHAKDPAEFNHNAHGPLNGHQVILSENGQPELSNPRTNVYSAKGSDFIIIRFK